MNNHFIFCCNIFCAEHEIDKFLESLGDTAIRDRYDIYDSDDKYLFYVDINQCPERLRGLTVYDYKTCRNYTLSNECLEILNRNTTKKQK